MDDERERERHHGLKSWDEHGTKGAGRAAKATSRKCKNWIDYWETLHIGNVSLPRCAARECAHRDVRGDRRGPGE